MPDNLQPKKRRLPRPYCLSVRALLGLVLIVGGGLGWAAHRATVQREAVAAIIAAGGSVEYDWDSCHDKPYQQARMPWPKWLRERLGPDYFGSVTTAWLDNRVADSVLPHLGQLDRLESLSITGMFLGVDDSRITGKGLANLAGIARLRQLSLQGSSLTDDDLVHLRTLVNLESLDLIGTTITDLGLVHVEDLSRLSSLNLVDSPGVTGDGLRHLRDMPRLSKLRLIRTRVADLSSIRDLIALETLELNESPITDRGLAAAASLTRLKTLDLTGTRVSDAGLEHVSRLPHLQTLSLAFIRVTNSGLDHLTNQPALTDLDVSGLSLSEQGLSYLAKIKTLTSLKSSPTAARDLTRLEVFGKAHPKLKILIAWDMFLH